MTYFVHHAEAQEFAWSLKDARPKVALAVLHTQLLRLGGAFEEMPAEAAIEFDTLDVLWLYKVFAKVFDTHGDLPRVLNARLQFSSGVEAELNRRNSATLVRDAVGRLIEVVESCSSPLPCNEVSVVRLFLHCYGHDDVIGRIVSGELGQWWEQAEPEW